MSETVVVIGASNNEARYSYKAMSLLMENGHRVIPVTPKEVSVLGVPAVARISDIRPPVDTVTVYVRPGLLAPSVDELISLLPKRIIFNPGTEDRAVMEKMRGAGIEVVEACTIVMQKTGQF
jgi:uncharacterized protein